MEPPIDVSINIFLFLFFFYIFFVFVFNIVTWLNVSEFNQMYEILAQLLVKHMGHLKRGRLAE